MSPFSPWRALRPGLAIFAVAAGGGLFPLARAAELPAPILLAVDSPAGAPKALGAELAVFSFLPSVAKHTGAAVLIVPDVPFAGNRLDGASLATARWLADHGMAGLVLRQTSSASADSRGAELTQALRSLRSRASEFKVSPDRIGLLGFGRGAGIAAEVAYAAAVAEPATVRPAFVALVWGSPEVAAVPAGAPPTFLVGSTLATDNLSGLIDLWGKLRAARVSVDTHFFAKRDAAPDAAFQDASAVSWPEMFYTWSRFQGFLTDQPRLALKGMAYLDGNPLPQGYVIFTPVDFVGAGPIVARVINSTAGEPIGQFAVPANQGPIAGRYKVELRQNMNRWLSNSFSGQLVNGRNGVSPEQAYFGHHRVLSPSIEDQKVFTKMRPSDSREYLLEFKADPAANADLKIEVFSQ